MNIEIFVISWFGRDEIREKRKELHQKQIDWFHEKWPDINVNIFAQEYENNEYLKNVNYIKNSYVDILSPGAARNELLKYFYNSNVDFGLFFDNDAVLYDHGDGSGFLNLFQANFKKYNDIDCFFPINPAMKGFKDMHATDKFQNNHVFYRNLQLKGTMFGLRNIKKYYDLELFMIPEMPTSEDVEFAHQLLVNNLSCYEFQNIVLKDFAAHHSTLNNSGVSDKEWLGNQRKIETSPWKNFITEKYKPYGMKLNKNGAWNRNDMYKKYWVKPIESVISKNNNNETFTFE